MTIRIIVNIHGLRLPQEGDTFELADIGLWQGHSYRLMSFYDARFVKIVGSAILNSDINANAFGHAVVGIDELEGKASVDEISKLMQHQTWIRFNQLNGFLQFLWFIKDNSVCIDQGFGYVPNLGQIFSIVGAFTNSTAGGVYTIETFTKEQLTEAYELFDKYVAIQPKKVKIEDTPYLGIEGGPNRRLINTNEGQDYNEYTRINRAILFLANARLTPELAQKIAMYVAVLECLFSVESDEIKHKVSERVAFYMGDTRERKKAIYGLIGECYNIRSRFIHGDELKWKGKKKYTREQLAKYSVEIDKLLRPLLRRVIEKDSSIFLRDENDKRDNKGEVIEEGLGTWLRNLIFQ